MEIIEYLKQELKQHGINEVYSDILPSNEKTNVACVVLVDRPISDDLLDEDGDIFKQKISIFYRGTKERTQSLDIFNNALRSISDAYHITLTEVFISLIKASSPSNFFIDKSGLVHYHGSIEIMYNY